MRGVDITRLPDAALEAQDYPRDMIDFSILGREETLKRIRESRLSAEGALKQTITAIVKKFDAIEDEYLRGRKYDIEQVGERHVAVRRVAGGHEAHFTEPQRVEQLERGTQVAEVNRVEGAAEDG